PLVASLNTLVLLELHSRRDFGYRCICRVAGLACRYSRRRPFGSAAGLAQTAPRLARTASKLARTASKLARTAPRLARTASKLARTAPKLARTAPRLARTAPPPLARTAPAGPGSGRTVPARAQTA